MASAAQPNTAERVLPAASGMASYIPFATGAALLTVAFWRIMTGIYGSWFDPGLYMEHGILVAPAAAYMAWVKRGKLSRVTARPSWWGVVLILWGALQATLGLAAQWVWVSRMALMVSLIGLIVTFYGFRMVRELLYPLCTLTLMIAPPSFVFEWLTLNLQLLATRMGEISLEFLGYSVLRDGNILELVGTKLSVEEACSGLRSLLSILFMCTLYDYFFVKGSVMRTIILVLAVPVAIVGNAGRIVATGIASQYNRELIHGTVHETFGYISVVVAGIGCVLIHVVMLYIQKTWRSSQPAGLRLGNS
jgi:exosortase